MDRMGGGRDGRWTGWTVSGWPAIRMGGSPGLPDSRAPAIIGGLVPLSWSFVVWVECDEYEAGGGACDQLYHQVDPQR
jgi:hypothetical protein